VVKVQPEELSLDQLLEQAAEPSATPTTRGPTDSVIGGADVTVYTSPVLADTGPAARTADAIQRDYLAKLDRGDLAIVNMDTRSVRRLAQGRHPSWYLPSPDGRMIALTDHLGVRGANNWRRVVDLYVITLRDGRLRLVARHLQQTAPRISWAPNSQALAFMEWGEGVDDEVRVVSASGGPA
jgi:hypothetical protein